MNQQARAGVLYLAVAIFGLVLFATGRVGGGIEQLKAAVKGEPAPGPFGKVGAGPIVAGPRRSRDRRRRD